VCVFSRVACSRCLVCRPSYICGLCRVGTPPGTGARVNYDISCKDQRVRYRADFDIMHIYPFEMRSMGQTKCKCSHTITTHTWQTVNATTGVIITRHIARADRGCRRRGVPTRHTHKWDGLHTRHLLERVHTQTHTSTNKHTTRPDKVRCDSSRHHAHTHLRCAQWVKPNASVHTQYYNAHLANSKRFNQGS